MSIPHTLPQRIAVALLCCNLGLAAARFVRQVGTLAAKQNVAHFTSSDISPAETQSNRQASPAVTQPADYQDAGRKEVMAGDIFSDQEELAYKGYVVQRRYRKVKYDYPAEYKEPSEWIEVSYAVLERNGKVVTRFDGGVYSGVGNGTRCGLFPLLGGKAKQLIISQDIPRGGVQWVVSLSPRLKVIYDGVAFGTGREGDDMRIVDLDKDGSYEIIQPLTAFYGFAEIKSSAQTPLPAVIFKYDIEAGKYLPANRQFRDYLLRDVEEAKKKISSPEDRSAHSSDILAIVLDYIFAGKEQDAWAFYEEAYKLPDKVELRKKIENTLRGHPVYHFLYPKVDH